MFMRTEPDSGGPQQPSQADLKEKDGETTVSQLKTWVQSHFKKVQKRIMGSGKKQSEKPEQYSKT